MAEDVYMSGELDVSTGGESISFFGGLYQYYDETERVPMYFPIGTTDWYSQVWWYIGNVDNRLKTGEVYFDFNFLGAEVREEWLEQNHQLLDEDDNQNNSYAYVALPSINYLLATTEPYWEDRAIDVSWEEISVDIPPGKTQRPTQWQAASNSSIDKSDNTRWTITDNNGKISRTLATRYFLRMDYINGGVPEGGFFDADAPIWLKANYRNDIDDLPEWVSAVPVEDVTNYDNSSFLLLKFTQWPSGNVNTAIYCTLTYKNVYVYDPCYTCAEHRYMSPDGEWEYDASTSYFTFTSKLNSDGTVIFDLGELQRNNYISLQHVVSIEFEFEQPGFYKLDDVRLIPSPSVEDDPVMFYHPAISPWKFLSDFTGFGATASGVTCLNIPYGYEQKDGRERGMKQTQYRQHCPFSSLSDDISYPKLLSRLVNELNYMEQISATYNQDVVYENMKDSDGNIIANGPYWWDLRRRTGDDSLIGECAIHVRNLVAVPYGTTPVPVTINAYYTINGRIHGVVIQDNQRYTGNGHSDTDDDGLFTLYRSTSVSGDWEAIGSCTPDEYGRFKSPPVHEDYYIYRLNDTYYYVSTRQYTIGAADVPTTEDIHKISGLYNINKVLFATDISDKIDIYRSIKNGDSLVKTIEISEIGPSLFYNTIPQIGTTTGHRHLYDWGKSEVSSNMALSFSTPYASWCCSGNRIIIAYNDNGVIKSAFSVDNGNTWEETGIIVANDGEEKVYPGIIVLADHSILVAYHKAGETSLTLKISKDGGRS